VGAGPATDGALGPHCAGASDPGGESPGRLLSGPSWGQVVVTPGTLTAVGS
jgi:hypothetical protein